ncbi:hypothetical protein SRABI128_03662 [Microbacterium sp. Bi128]|nr:hypothetical protein SRABI128_03662 [Microbacterium sp. Bi128]
MVRVRWWLVVLFVALGVSALLFGGWVAYGGSPWREEQAAFWSGLFVNVGTTLLLAAVLVWFERILLRQVRSENETAISTAATSAAQQAAETAAEATAARLVPRLNQMDEEIRTRSSARAASRTRSAVRLAELPTYEAVDAAFNAATSINAIRSRAGSTGGEGSGEVVVPAGVMLSAPRVRVLYLAKNSNFPARIVFEHTSYEAQAVWTEDKDAADVLDELSEALVRVGGAEVSRSLSAQGLLENLSALLADAVAGRQAEQGAWVSTGPVFEMICKDWYLTDKGLEIRGRGVAIPRSAFGKWIRGTDRRTQQQLPPGPPQGLSEDAWSLAVARGDAYYPGPPFEGFFG